MDEDARTLYCGNLSEKVTEDILYELFLQSSLHEGFLDSPRPPCFINGSQVSLPEGRNILGILVTY
ncbi:hypothetical protein ALC57_09040 [Trachymyrmex cornetzi]|uniref:Uncharacterized protein n=1 Tax=Trachymyrmex cornetzi TaxID=471704 RepID=A0A151J5Y9_9HYME|nr:hypothetical protein ALC57_09040 [Trachymyrmex cornetzi]